MARQEFCNCSEKGTYALGIVTLVTGELACNNCRGLIPPSELGAEVLSQPASEAKQKIKPVDPDYAQARKGLSLNGEIDNGNAAALRTKNYATLFETIGKFLQFLNIVAVVLLIIVVLIISTSSALKILYVIGIFTVWGVSYVQTCLIRGLASYFQMKASDHIIRNWAK